MMKKLFVILLAGLLMLSMVACDLGNTEDPNKDNPGTSQSGNQGGENNGGDSADGKTAKVEGASSVLVDFKSNDVEHVLEASGLDLNKMGIPNGYNHARTQYSGAYGMTLAGAMTNFAKVSGEITDADVDAYAAVIWNVCVDAADNGVLYTTKWSAETGDSRVIYKTITEARDDSKKYSNYVSYFWRYEVDGISYTINVGVDEEENFLIVDFNNKGPVDSD